MEIKWAAHTGLSDPILKLKKSGIQLNSKALKLLGAVARVKAGVFDGYIILVENYGPKSYAVSRNKRITASSAGIGSKALAKCLMDGGAEEGEYVLNALKIGYAWAGCKKKNCSKGAA